MDDPNEKRPEAVLDCPESSSVVASCDNQESDCVNISVESPSSAKNSKSENISQCDKTPSPSNQNSNDLITSVDREETECKTDNSLCVTSPHSSHSDGSKIEITLDRTDAEEDVEQKTAGTVPALLEGVGKDVPKEDVVEKVDCVFSPAQEQPITERSDGETPSTDENKEESGMSDVDNVCISVDSKKNNIEEARNCEEKVKSMCSLLPSDICVKDGGDSVGKDGDEANGQSLFSVDTSIFPGPPGDGTNMVTANCFEPGVGNEGNSQSAVTEDSSVVSILPLTAHMKDISGPAGPSDDREDISDEDFDEEPPKDFGEGHDSTHRSGINEDVAMVSAADKFENSSLNSGEVGDIIDLKLEDAALKSIGSSCDMEENRQSKVSNEDLETVSDDEFPSAPQTDRIPNPGQAKPLEEMEEVSSSEDEEISQPQNSVTLSISSGAEKQTVDVSESNSLSRLESLEAEPISDEEDNMNNDESKQASFDDGEAGEIKSPAIGSPISEQGDLMLGEVEPVSADDQDTDGELPSGDEADKDDGTDKKFESIDSEEDMGDDSQKICQQPSDRSQQQRKSSDANAVSKGGKGEYMETISDEENLDGDESEKKHDSGAPTTNRESVLEKTHMQSSFNEHQLELDYEEAYGEDGEGRPPETLKTDSKDTDKEEGEENDEEQGLASDKDEGELSDDDCEEGEIKEPGQKKVFIKPLCRFFLRGNCTWGINCRFLHPGINDKGNYQMIEIPGFKPGGIRARLGVQGQWPEQPPPEEEVELPPPPMPDVPHVETAWERGLRIAKEQRKKASERKEQEPDFEDKRLNLSVDEERELNKENERQPKIIPKDPYYDQQAYEVDEYYKIPRDPWHTGHYENFEVRYHRENSYSPPYSPPYREKPMPPPMRFTRPLSPPVDKFGRNRDSRPEVERHEPFRVSDYPPPSKHPDEWVDPWQRSKSPKQRKPRSRSRGRRDRRSLSDSSDSSRSSQSSSGSSRSSRSGSGSSGSSSRSPEPAPPGVDRVDRSDRYGGDQPRSMVSVRGHQGHRDGHRNDNNLRYDRNRMYNNNNSSNNNNSNHPGGDRNNSYKNRPDFNNSYQGGGGRGGYYGHNTNYRGMNNRRGQGRGGGPGGYNNNNNNRDMRGGRDPRYARNFSPTRGGRGGSPDRPLPYPRRPKSRSSSRSSSSRSRSRSRSKSSDSSRSSSNTSRSSSSSSSSGSADSDHLYRDLGSPSKQPRHKKRGGGDVHKDRVGGGGGGGAIKSNHHPGPGQAGSRHHQHHHHQHPPPPSSSIQDRLPHPRSPSRGDPKYSQIPLPPPGSRADAKYASRNAPLPPVKAKDPLKVVGQKSNIKLTLLPKQQQQQSSLGDRPNPLASPPRKRRLSDRDGSPLSAPASKRPAVALQASGLRVAAEKAAKINMRQEKGKSPPPGSLPPVNSSQRSKLPPPSSSSLPSPQKQQQQQHHHYHQQQQQAAGKTTRTASESTSAKTSTKAPPGGSSSTSSSTGASSSGTKSKKSMSSRREELLKQLKAVEDAIARKKVC